MFSATSTLFSIGQQIHYAISFRLVKIAVFDRAVQSLTTPSLGFGGAAQVIDVGLYWIRRSHNLLEGQSLTAWSEFYCYNVMAICVLFWYVTPTSR